MSRNGEGSCVTNVKMLVCLAVVRTFEPQMNICIRKIIVQLHDQMRCAHLNTWLVYQFIGIVHGYNFAFVANFSLIIILALQVNAVREESNDHHRNKADEQCHDYNYSFSP